MYESCARCQFLKIFKDQSSFVFNKETYTYDLKPEKPKFKCGTSFIEDPRTFCCDNFLIKDDEEYAEIEKLLKTFEERGW